jgi:hypothetical protein
MQNSSALGTMLQAERSCLKPDEVKDFFLFLSLSFNLPNPSSRTMLWVYSSSNRNEY